LHNSHVQLKAWMEIPKSRIKPSRMELTFAAIEYQYSGMNVLSGIYGSHYPESQLVGTYGKIKQNLALYQKIALYLCLTFLIYI